MRALHDENVLIPFTCWKLVFVHHALKYLDNLCSTFEELGQWIAFRSRLVLDEYSLSIVMCDWITGLAIFPKGRRILCFVVFYTFYALLLSPPSSSPLSTPPSPSRCECAMTTATTTAIRKYP